MLTPKRNSGTYANDNYKNIFDLEGNLYERTAQTNATKYRATRGAAFTNYNAGTKYPISSFYSGDYAATDKANDASSRIMLYIK